MTTAELSEQKEENLLDVFEESPPPWLQQYMKKMKQEIKKEVIEELLSVSPEVKQVLTPDNQNSKTGSVIKEENSLQYQGEVIHSGIYCDNCDQLIHGIRYKCGNCSDFDLCQECESLPNVHNRNHIFLKIRYPIALKLYQKQKWQELMSPLPIKSSRLDATHSKNHSKKLYEAKFLCDETVPDSTVIPPSSRFVKSWKVMNSGTRVWTHATKLHLIQGSADLIPSSEQVDVPHLKPGEEGIVSVLFTAPSVPGVYRSHWNFCHKSRPFGHIVWCHIIVKPIQEELRTQQSLSTDINELSEKIVNKQMEVSSIADVLTAVTEEGEGDNMVPRKLIVNSHTATPNNTPFALTPPKSPDHETITKSACELASDNPLKYDSDDDDECSVVSISSFDSEAEFVVIPMPRCFNFSETFISQHLRLPHSLVETDNTAKTEEHKENSGEKQAVRKTMAASETVSQETGVPELSETVCESDIQDDGLPILRINQQKTHISHIAPDGSSSEISIIESGSSSPSTENETKVFEAINVELSSDNSPPCETTRFAIHFSDSSVTESSDVVKELNKVKNQEQTNDILCSATFPKFPVEGITGEIYERPTSNIMNNPEERTIQVLPEGLVIGALSAAASVYNTARAVISNMQQPRTENPEGLSQPLQRLPERVSLPVNRQESLNPMDQLIEMGFCNRQQNEAMLKKHKGNVASVVAELVNLNDNDWYESRHTPTSPPGFLD